MRINRLEIAGFGPYKQRQVVDFDAFAADGIFLIAGKTGAGKSSILDAICFALYNAVPRYDGTDKQLRSHHADPDEPSEVMLEFTIGDTRYRVTRSPDYERPAKRGGGMTPQKATALLEIQRADGWEGLAAIPRDVAHELDRILGLKKEQFLQVILLAQNRFQEFLLAKNDARQEVLQALFGTQRFADYEQRIVERAKALAAELAESDAQRARDAARVAELVPLIEPVEINPTDDWFLTALTTLGIELESANTAVNTARIRALATEQAHRTLEEQREQRRRLDTARESLELVELQRDDITLITAQLANAEKAAIVEPSLAAVTAAEQARDAAATAEHTARTAFADFAPDLVDDDALAARLDADRASLGALDDALADERALPSLATAVAAADIDLARIDDLLSAGDERAAALPALIAEASAAATATRLEAARRDDAEQTHARLTAQLASAATAERLATQLDTAREAELAASRAQTVASTNLDDVLVRQLHGRAWVLAAALEPGEPCAVCGSTEHPAPAKPTDDDVSDEDVEKAHAAVDTARAAFEKARTRASELASEAAAAKAAAGDATEDQLAAAKTALATAVAAEKRLAAEQSAVEKLETERDEAAGARERLKAERAEAQVASASARERQTAAGERVTRHRGDHDTVAARADALRKAVTAAAALQAAVATLRQRAESLDAASAKATAQLAEHGFETAEAASEALISKPERAALEQRVRAHSESEAIARATLAEVAEVPAVEPEAIAQARAALDDAAQARDAATRAQGAITHRHAQLAALVTDVSARSAASAGLRARHEQVASLAAAVKGDTASRMRLETYVLAAQLEQIVDAANARLTTMTAGRYELQHDDSVQFRKTQSGLGVSVLDQHTGRARSPHSLSGGETFLASLALALGLADVVTAQSGGITLDTLFVDEGFGSLDADTLEIAMGTLDSLRAGGRTIGLISHVGAMKEQIPAKLSIQVAAGGWSEIVR